MKRQLVQTDCSTGKVIHYYVDVGKGRARSRMHAIKPINSSMQATIDGRPEKSA